MKNSNKGFAVPRLLSTIILIALIAVLGVFVYLRAASSVPEPEQTGPEALEAEPTPVPEMRSIAIVCPSSGDTAVDASVCATIDALKQEFYDTVENAPGKALNVYGKEYESGYYYSLALNVEYDGVSRFETHIYRLEDGAEVSVTDALGESYVDYFCDYFTRNLLEFTSTHAIAETGDTVLIGYSDTEKLLADNGYAPGTYHTFEADTFEHVVFSGRNAVVIFDPDSVFEGCGRFEFPIPERVYSGEYYNLRRLYLDRPMVALTFDDGPNADCTPAVLDCLEANGAVATFFQVGVHVDEYPEITKRAYDIGCEIGSHTYSHINLSTASLPLLEEDKAKCDAAFLNAIGCLPTVTRPPEGSMGGNAKYFYDTPYIGWSVDTLDWSTHNAGSSIYTVKNFRNIDWELNLDGQVILLHDIYVTSVEAACEIIPWLVQEGYQTVTITELLKYHYGIEPQPCIYYSVDYFLYHKEPQ